MESQQQSIRRVAQNIRNHVKGDGLLYLILLIYVVLIFAVIRVHEPWADEAQAWLLARDSTPFELMFQNLRYEGHPGLWYLLLILPSKLLPYRAISMIAALIAIAGVYVLLRYAPFPKPIRWLLPFSYFVFYQYGVIARSYVLLPLLFFLIAHVYKEKTTRIYQFTTLICLLAYTSVYTSLVALSIMLVHLADLIRMRHELDRELIGKQIKAYVGFALVLVLIAIQLWPPEDVSFARGFHFNLLHSIKLSSTVFNEAMTEVSYLSALILILSLRWFWQRGVFLLFLLSTLSVLTLFSIKYYNSWHQGILFLVWIFVMWISFQRPQSEGNTGRLGGVTKKVVVGSILLVLGIQVFWAGAVSIADSRGPYSAGEDIAEYIRSHPLEHKKIYATTFWSTAIQPYFDENIFANHNHGKKPAFWRWSLGDNRNQALDEILKAQPDLLIIGRPEDDLRVLPGYTFVGIFPGEIYWKNRIKERNDFALFRLSATVSHP